MCSIFPENDEKARTLAVTTEDLDQPTKPGDIVSMKVAIEEVGFGKAQIVILLLSGLVFCADCAEVTYLSFVTEVLRCQWGLTPKQESMIGSAVFIGIVIGCLLMGYVGDHLGRRPAFLLSSCVICICGFATCFAQGPVSLIIIRTVVGIGISGVTVAYDVLCEAVPANHRGAIGLVLEFFWTGGGLWVILCAWLSLNSEGWRLFTALTAVPTLIAAIAGYFMLPESPRWLAEMHREPEAVKIINQWAVMNGKDFHIKGIHHHDGTHGDTLCVKCDRKLVCRFLILIVPWFAFGACYFGVVMLLPRLFETDGKSSACDIKFNYGELLIPCGAEVLGLIWTIAWIDTVGRRWTTCVSFFTGGAACMVLGFRNLNMTILTLAASIGRGAQMAASCAIYVHTPEVFPTHLRAQTHALLNLICKIAAAFAPFLISKEVPQKVCAAVFMSLSFAGGIAILFLPETAGIDLEVLSDDERSTEATSSEEDCRSDSSIE